MVAIGKDLRTGKPFDLPPGHLLIVGSSGSSKTASLERIVTERIRQSRTQNVLLAIDPATDLRLANCLKEEAEKAGRPFYVLSPDPHVDSCVFNPCQSWDLELRPREAVANWGESSALVHSVFTYGESYHSSSSKRHCRISVKLLRDQKIFRPTWLDVLAVSEAASKKVGVRDALHPAMLVEELAGFPILTETAPPEKTIDIPRSFKERAVVYCGADSLNDQTELLLLRFVLWSFLGHAAHRFHRGNQRVELDLFIDEANEFFSVGLARLLNQSRKYATNLICCCQHLEPASRRSMDLGPVFLTGFRNQLFFTAIDERIVKHIQSHSKDILKEVKTSVSGKPLEFQHSETVSFIKEPTFERNDCIEASAALFEGVAIIRDGKKHREPIHFRITPACDATTAERRENTPLPPRREHSAHDHVTVSQPSPPKQCQSAFAALWDAKEKSLAWETMP